MTTSPVSKVRVRAIPTPATVIAQLPASDEVARRVLSWRQQIERILLGADDRLLVVVGPCSIHDPAAAMEYAARLQAAAAELADDVFIVMRAYFQKPRTTTGWKGFMTDPSMDDSFEVHRGVRLSRRMLLEFARLGLPAATEFLDVIVHHFISDLVSWGVIGARTAESQLHRELASGLPMPIGFKNGTDGNTRIAIDAITAAQAPHQYLGTTTDGSPAIIETAGNACCHVVLRGGRDRPNYELRDLEAVAGALRSAGLPPFLMIDCSHGNSGSDHERQKIVARYLCDRLAEGKRTIVGVMLESNLVAGRQAIAPRRELTYGQSVTDACLGWDDTRRVLTELASAVRARRSNGTITSR